MEEVARVRPGTRVLDLGCGPGRLLDALPDPDYVGLDVDGGHLAAARRRYGDSADFRLADVTRADLSADPPFDLVLAIGLLHHLDDDGARAALRVAARALAPGGRLLSLDPGRAPGQPALARWLAGRDRGAHIRAPEAYGELARSAFDSVSVGVHHDLARVPYTHVLVDCRDPRASSP